ncbi:hypothetical protein KP509_15G024300 [Ceratopteris richardii]|uniref:Uncharacterized protein n=1 Tax=Ceratopteris richardii TaxID=49495 RepID=A0A8T2T6I4_CERRI|nr:hypothetical protein KP509_15G024300 [Ceratopteris richardii]
MIGTQGGHSSWRESLLEIWQRLQVPKEKTRRYMPHFPYQGTSPFVSEPRDIREIPIGCKDEQLKSSQFHPHIFSDEDDFSMSRSNNTKPWSLASNMDLNGKYRSVDGP